MVLTKEAWSNAYSSARRIRRDGCGLAGVTVWLATPAEPALYGALMVALVAS